MGVMTTNLLLYHGLGILQLISGEKHFTFLVIGCFRGCCFFREKHLSFFFMSCQSFRKPVQTATWGVVYRGNYIMFWKHMLKPFIKNVNEISTRLCECGVKYGIVSESIAALYSWCRGWVEMYKTFRVSRVSVHNHQPRFSLMLNIPSPVVSIACRLFCRCFSC